MRSKAPPPRTQHCTTAADRQLRIRYLHRPNIWDKKARDLTAAGATGGPTASKLPPGFFVGYQPSLGGNPKGLPFTSQIFDLYQAWTNIYRSGPVKASRQAVGARRGAIQQTPITITGVAGINDLPGFTTVTGFCGTCHDTPDVGNHSVKLPINIGIANGGPQQ